MRLHHEGSMIRVHCQLMICRGHIRVSMGTLKIFLWLTVVCENLHFSQILHFFFISAAISIGRKRVRRSKNLLRAQSKYGLMGSSAKTGKKFPWVTGAVFG